jgi:hypothetical protein
MIQALQAAVRAFHKAFGVPYRDRPAEAHEVNWPRHTTRGAWIASELKELEDAIVDCDVAGAADGYLDIIYFAAGGLEELGVKGSPLLEAIHRANMTKIKLPGVDKIAKPPGFIHPDIASLIESQKKGRP